MNNFSQLLTLARFIGYQNVNEAMAALQNFDGFVFEHEQVRLRVSLAKRQPTDKEDTDELPRDSPPVQNGVGHETAESHSDQR